MTVPGAAAVLLCAPRPFSGFFGDTMHSWGAAPRWDTSGRDVPNIATLGFTKLVGLVNYLAIVHSIPYSKAADYFYD